MVCATPCDSLLIHHPTTVFCQTVDTAERYSTVSLIQAFNIFNVAWRFTDQTLQTAGNK